MHNVPLTLLEIEQNLRSRLPDCELWVNLELS